jgi:hypothetical protein
MQAANMGLFSQALSQAWVAGQGEAAQRAASIAAN